MKKIISFLLIISLLITALALVSCGNDPEPSGSVDEKTTYVDPPLSERDYYIESDPLPDMYMTEDGVRIDGVTVMRTSFFYVNYGGGKIYTVDDATIWGPFKDTPKSALSPVFEDENLVTLYSSKLDSYSVFCGDEEIEFEVGILEDDFWWLTVGPVGEQVSSFTSENIDLVPKGKYMAYAGGIFLNALPPEYGFEGGSTYGLFFWLVVE